MEIEIRTWLYDITNAIAEIDSFFKDTPKTFTTYQKDLRTRRAVERNIEIIGEALNRILTIKPAIEISNSVKLLTQEIELYMAMITCQMKLSGALLSNIFQF